MRRLRNIIWRMIFDTGIGQLLDSEWARVSLVPEGWRRHRPCLGRGAAPRAPKRVVAATDAGDGRVKEVLPRSTRQAPIDTRPGRINLERKPTLHGKLEPSETIVDLC